MLCIFVSWVIFIYSTLWSIYLWQVGDCPHIFIEIITNEFFILIFSICNTPGTRVGPGTMDLRCKLWQSQLRKALPTLLRIPNRARHSQLHLAFPTPLDIPNSIHFIPDWLYFGWHVLQTLRTLWKYKPERDVPHPVCHISLRLVFFLGL